MNIKLKYDNINKYKNLLWAFMSMAFVLLVFLAIGAKKDEASIGHSYSSSIGLASNQTGNIIDNSALSTENLSIYND